MWFLVLVEMIGTSVDVHPLEVFLRYEECMVVLHEVEFGVQGEHETLVCIKESSETES